MSNQLGRTCTACGKSRNKKGIMYDPQTLLPYCDNPWVCNDEHPNSPKNLIARQSELHLVPFETAQQAYKKHLMATVDSSEDIDRIRRLVEQPTTVRIGEPEMAKFIVELMHEYNFTSVSDAIRHCVQEMKNAKGVYYDDHKYITQKVNEEKALQETASELEQSHKPKPDKVAEKTDAPETPSEEFGIF